MLQKRGFEIINLTLSNTTKLILLDSFLQEVTAINPYLSKADPAYKVLVPHLMGIYARFLFYFTVIFIFFAVKPKLI